MDNYNTSGGLADLNNSNSDLAAIIDDLENDNNLPRPTFPANPAEPTEFEVENLLNETLTETLQDIEQTQHHWSGSQQCLHHLQYSGNVATVYTVQAFLSFQDRIALSCLLSSPPALQPRPKISNLKPFDIMTVKQALIEYSYSRLNIRKCNTAHYMNIWYKMHTYHNILLKYAHI